METLDLKDDLMPGSIKFGPGRRDATRDANVLKFDGNTLKQFPGVYSWNGNDGN
jgi:hypothetical protein